jgi:hypothetical protein
MEPGTAAAMPRTSGALLVSRVPTNVAEFRRRTLAPDDQQASSMASMTLLQLAHCNTRCPSISSAPGRRERKWLAKQVLLLGARSAHVTGLPSSFGSHGDAVMPVGR